VADVPNVVGQGRDAAQAALERAGFQVKVEESESSFDDKGTVTSQDPQGGASVEAGSQVKITVGTGPSTVKVPSVYGNTPDQAAGILADYELELGTVSKDYTGEVAEGQIFYQDPAQGESIEPGSSVAVTVSLGPEQVEVPEVFGLTLAEAQDAVANAGFYYNVVKVEDNEPEGTALSTEPGAGALLAPGATVTIYYSGGPPEPTTSSPAPDEGNGAPAPDEGNGAPAPDEGNGANNIREALREGFQGGRGGDNSGNRGKGNGGGNSGGNN
jgi:eukaryotic-like serine/threonine-protein kinase